MTLMAIGYVALVIVAVLTVRNQLLPVAALLSVVTGALLTGGWLGDLTDVVVRVLSRWGGHLSESVGGQTMPWVLAAVAVAVFTLGVLQGGSRAIVVLGLFVAPLLATIPGEFGRLGSDAVQALVDLWVQLIGQGLGGASR